MKLRGRSILVIALLIFGGYAVYEYFKDRDQESRKLEEARLLTVNFEQVDKVILEKGSQRILLKRSVDGWNLEEPIKDLADNSAVEDLVKNAATEKIIEVAKAGSDVDWALYGLDKPLGKISFVTTAGAKNVFTISEKRNFEENAFARRDSEQRVLVLNSVWQSRMNKGLIDFRDRRVLRHKMAAIDSLKVKNSVGLLELQLQEGKWISPVRKDLVLDQNKVRELLQGIADAKAAEYVEALPELKPLFTLNLKLADKTWSAEVGQAKDFKIYAKISDPQFKMRLESGSLDRFIKLSIEDLKEAPPSKDNKGKPDALAEQKDKK